MNTQGNLTITVTDLNKVDEIVSAIAVLANTLTVDVTVSIHMQPKGIQIAHSNGNGATDEVTHPTPTQLAAASAESSNEPWCAPLSLSLQTLVTRLESGELSWRNLNRKEKAAILTAVVQSMAAQEPVTMASFEKMKPHYMPTASALATMFGDGLWKQMIEKAQSRELA